MTLLIAPPSSADEKLTILWDDTHDDVVEDAGGDELNTNYLQFANLVAVTEGHTLNELNGVQGLSAAELAGVDVLMIFDAEDEFTAAEILAVEAFVNGGGLLFLTGEAPLSFNQAFNNALLDPFDIQFTPTGFVGDLVNFTPHALTAGVGSIDFTNGGELGGDGSQALGSSSGGMVGLATAADGKVVVLADSNALDNVIGDSSPGALGANEAQFVRNLLGYFLTRLPEEGGPIAITIDIRPGDVSNAVNPKSKGVVPVAILTTAVADGDPIDFDPWDSIDVTTLRFGPDEAVLAHVQGDAEDVDGDGDLDMVVHFRVPEVGVACGDTSLTLTGATVIDGEEGGDEVVGTDTITTPGCE
jgi:hypothetical protein